ncbi:MAG: hypothetical protein V7740_03460 [Pseudomonas marincola]
MALGYPYQRPDYSFIIRGETVTELIAPVDTTNLTPVIACGSNGAPSQLARKFPNSDEPIIATAIELDDFLCCYSAHIAGYGAIPATLVPYSGVTTSCHMTWLTQNQLEKMHESEALGVNYKFSKLENISIRSKRHAPLDSAFAYISLHGHLVDNGTPIALADIPLQANGNFPRQNQQTLQELAIKKLSLPLSVEEFVLENIKNKNIRDQRIQAMKAISQPFKYHGETTFSN